VSVGISIYPDHGDEAERLVKEADTAMYLVKHAGKNNYAFSGGIAPQAPHHQHGMSAESKSIEIGIGKVIM